jgi:hypothetical protein
LLIKNVNRGAGEDQLDRSVKNAEALYRIKEERNILHTIKLRKTNWIGHLLRRNCLLKHVIEGKIDGKGRRRRRRNQRLDDQKENKKYRNLTQEGLHRTLWRTCFRRGYAPVARQTT